MICLALALPATPSWAGHASARYRFGTFNLLHDFPFFRYRKARLEIAAQQIAAQGLDVVGLEEASQTPTGNAVTKLGRRLNWHHVFYPMEGALGFYYSGLGIVSRFPIVKSEVFRFKEQGEFLERMSVARALLKTPDGDVSFYVTHLTGQSKASNLSQARELADFVARTREGGPAVIVGDFNAEPDSPSLRHLAAQGWLNVQESAHGRTKLTCCACITATYYNPVDPCPRKPEKAFRESIDHVFVVTGAGFAYRILSSGLFLDSPGQGPNGNPLRASDHSGVYAELQLEP